MSRLLRIVEADYTASRYQIEKVTLLSIDPVTGDYRAGHFSRSQIVDLVRNHFDVRTFTADENTNIYSEKVILRPIRENNFLVLKGSRDVYDNLGGLPPIGELLPAEDLSNRKFLHVLLWCGCWAGDVTTN